MAYSDTNETVSRAHGLEYLQAAGFKISRPTFFRAISSGKLIPTGAGGKLTIGDLDRYAGIFLHRAKAAEDAFWLPVPRAQFLERMLRRTRYFRAELQVAMEAEVYSQLQERGMDTGQTESFTAGLLDLVDAAWTISGDMVKEFESTGVEPLL